MFLQTDKALFKVVHLPAFALSSETLGEMFHFSLRLSVLTWLADRTFGSGTWNFPFAHLCCIVCGALTIFFMVNLRIPEVWLRPVFPNSQEAPTLLFSPPAFSVSLPLLRAAVYSEAEDVSHKLRLQGYFNREKGSKFCRSLLTHCIAVTPI